MLRAIITAFRIREIRNKILFTLGILAIYRLGANITIPGVDAEAILSQVETGVLGMMDLFAGGALGNFAVFSLGIMPYITATIIIIEIGKFIFLYIFIQRIQHLFFKGYSKSDYRHRVTIITNSVKRSEFKNYSRRRKLIQDSLSKEFQPGEGQL